MQRKKKQEDSFEPAITHIASTTMHEVVEPTGINEQSTRTSRLSWKRLGIIALVFIFILGGLGYWGYRWYTSPEVQQARVEKENAALVQDVSRLMRLPEEKPVVYEVNDPELLSQNQPFFQGAQKGDKLLIYSQAAKAIIYSPEENIIVNVGPVTFDQPQAPSTELQQPVEEPQELKVNE